MAMFSAFTRERVPSSPPVPGRLRARVPEFRSSAPVGYSGGVREFRSFALLGHSGRVPEFRSSAVPQFRGTQWGGGSGGEVADLSPRESLVNFHVREVAPCAWPVALGQTYANVPVGSATSAGLPTKKAKAARAVGDRVQSGAT